MTMKGKYQRDVQERIITDNLKVEKAIAEQRPTVNNRDLARLEREHQRIMRLKTGRNPWLDRRPSPQRLDLKSVQRDEVFETALDSDRLYAKRRPLTRRERPGWQDPNTGPKAIVRGRDVVIRRPGADGRPIVLPRAGVDRQLSPTQAHRPATGRGVALPRRQPATTRQQPKTRRKLPPAPPSPPAVVEATVLDVDPQFMTQPLRAMRQVSRESGGLPSGALRQSPRPSSAPEVAPDEEGEAALQDGGAEPPAPTGQS